MEKKNFENVAGNISETSQKDNISFGGDIMQNDDVTNQESNVEDESEEDASEAVEESTLSLGRIQGGVYTNEYAGFACELDSTWEFYSAEELQDLPENIAELMEGTELGENIDSYEQIMDMQAECVNDLTGINVLYQKMDMQERLAYASLDEEQLMEYMLTQKDLLTESYAQTGIIVEEMSTKQVTFAGEERIGLLTKAKFQDIDYYIFQLFNHDLGQYSVTISFSSFVEDKTDEIIALFYAL